MNNYPNYTPYNTGVNGQYYQPVYGSSNLNNQFMAQPYNNASLSFANQANTNQLQPLVGKIVDGVDVVKATEVPLGGYAIFPKADFSEIYIKRWNADGTTQISTFSQTVNANGADASKPSSDIILSKLSELENKLDQLKSSFE